MAIETTSSTVPPPSVFDTLGQRPRPQDVGILGIEMYFPQRVTETSLPPDVSNLSLVHLRGRTRGL
jgi:hypothetical protein